MKRKFWICNRVNATTAEILMYGYVGEYEEINDADFISDLRKLESMYQVVNIRVNCGGGDVHKGMTIFNAIRNSKAHTNGYVDGIAASMGAVMIAGCKNVYMSKYARYMTHRVTGGMYGNAEEMRAYADELEALEDNISAILSKRTGLTKEDARQKYITDKDRWIGAEQALAEKLIDGIYDADPVDIPEGSDEQVTFNVFQNKLIHTNDTQMKEIAKALGLPEDATEAQITAEINKQKQAAEASKNAAKAAVKAKAKALIDDAVGAKKIKETEREQWQKNAEENYEFTEAAINKIPGSAKVTDALNKKDVQVAGAGEDADNWETLLKKGDAAVAAFKAADPDGYKKMWEAHYGTKFPENIHE